MSKIRNEIPDSEYARFREVYILGGQEYAVFSYFSDIHTPEKFVIWVVVPKKAVDVFPPLLDFLSNLFDEVVMGDVGEWTNFARVRYLIKTNISHDQTLPKLLAGVVVRMLPLIRRTLLVVRETVIDVEDE